MASITQELFRQFAQLKPADFKKISEADLVSLLPKRSIGLSTNLLKEIFRISDPRLLALRGHLYFDHILTRMLERQLEHNSRLTFAQKVTKLHALGSLSRREATTLRELNKLRNAFAHQAFYDFVAWDPSDIPFVVEQPLRSPRRRDLLVAFKTVLLRLTFMCLLFELYETHRWVYLEDIPGAQKSRTA